MRIVVAGGTGFLGGNVAAALARAGHEVVIASRHQPSPGRPGSGLPWLNADVTVPGSLDAALSGAKVVVDAVQFPNSPIENPARGYTFERIDLQGTRNLVDASVRQGAGLFVGLSGVGADASAAFPWLRCKAREEQHIAASKMPYIIFRPSWIYGPGDVSLNRFLAFSRFLPFVPVIGDGKSRINPLFINDLASHIVAAVQRDDLQGRTFEIGGPELLTMNQVIKTALRVRGRRRLLLHSPLPVMRIAGRLAEHMPGRPLTAGAVDFITSDGVADTQSLTQAFGLPLTPLEDGLRTYLA